MNYLYGSVTQWLTYSTVYREYEGSNPFWVATIITIIGSVAKWWRHPSHKRGIIGSNPIRPTLVSFRKILMTNGWYTTTDRVYFVTEKLKLNLTYKPPKHLMDDVWPCKSGNSVRFRMGDQNKGMWLRRGNVNISYYLIYRLSNCRLMVLIVYPNGGMGDTPPHQAVSYDV